MKIAILKFILLQVYVKHRSIKDGLLNEETILKALEDVLGEPLGEELKSEMWGQLGVSLKSHMMNFNYKQFCGVSAMIERLFCEKFSTAQSESTNSESKSEIEVADFDRLLSKIENIRMDNALRDLLVKIKNSGLTAIEKSEKGLSTFKGSQLLTSLNADSIKT